MKRVSKFFMVLAALIMGMGLMLQSCGGLTASTLAAQMSKECPQDLGEGLTMQSVVADGNYIVFNVVVPDGVPVDAVKAALDQDRAGFISLLKESDPDSFDAIGTLGCGIKMIFQNSEGKVEIQVEPSELKK